MLTRRTIIGAGLAIAPAGHAAVLGGHDLAPRRPEAHPIDALLIDENIQTPRPMAAFLKHSRRALPVVAIKLDASGQAGLRRVLSTSQAIVGVSSGATLFCLERIAWDHGFRLTERSQRRADDPDDEASRQALADLLSGARRLAPTASPLLRAYRPSRADGMLHTWVMRKPADPQFRQWRREA